MDTMRKTIEETSETNVAEVTGVVTSEITYNHTSNGQNFYNFVVDVKRLSQTYDSLIVMLPEDLLENTDYLGKYVHIKGQFRSYNQKQNGRTQHLHLYLFARSIEFIDSRSFADKNILTLTGYICKPPIYRTTPAGKNIADVMLAVNRPFGKSDYLPCIFWGRNAYYIANFKVGRLIKLDGRMQSRLYNKTLPDGSVVELTAYEISVSSFSEL